MTPTTEVRERPILFSGPMVRAILDGSKTQTRRVVKGVPRGEEGDYVRLECGAFHPTIIVRGEEEPGDETFGATTPDGEWATQCPYGQPGDRLWVRETWGTGGYFPWPYGYRADGKEYRGEKWRPSIFMPRDACRIKLEITEVRVQRLQDMDWRDALAEGIAPEVCDHIGAMPQGCTDCMNTGILEDPRYAYAELWDSLNEKRGYSWESNPFVWALTFRRA